LFLLMSPPTDTTGDASRADDVHPMKQLLECQSDSRSLICSTSSDAALHHHHPFCCLFKIQVLGLLDGDTDAQDRPALRSIPPTVRKREAIVRTCPLASA
jgi:hypothetical protein